MDEFWREVVPEHEPVRTRWFLPLVGVLLVFNVPWYLPRAVAEQLWGGVARVRVGGVGNLAGPSGGHLLALLRAWRDRVDWGSKRAGDES